MPQRVPLDPALTAAPFSIAQARAMGVGRGRLEGADLARPFYGVRSTGDHGRIAAYVPRLRPGDRFSHTSAAELWGAPLPARLRDEVHVTAGPGLERPRAQGVIGHVGGESWASRGPFPVSDPARMFVELGTILTLEDLVAVGDHLVLDPHVLDPFDLRPHSSLAELTAFLDHSAAGVRLARRAIKLVQEGVESAMETRLRLVLRRGGLPEPACGYELLAGSGRRIGWFDLAWPDYRVIAEYDGDQHRTSIVQYDRDIARFDAAADEDWRVIRVRRAGLLDAPATVTRVATALARNGWAPKSRRNIRRAEGG